MAEGDEAEVQRPSSSSMALPELSPQTASFSATGTDFKSRAAQRQLKVQERRIRAKIEGPHRKAFLGGLLNEDLQNLTKWHGMRPQHEQKRFVKAVDKIYNAFCKMEGTDVAARQAQALQMAKTAQEQQAQVIAAQQAIANQDDPYLRESPRGGPTLGASASAPNLPTKPIEVFEQNKRKNNQRNTGEVSDRASATSSEMYRNGLEKWMDAQSVATSMTQTTSTTRFTTLSQMSGTSSGGSISLCSEQGTTNQMAYRFHKRGLAANQRKLSKPSGDQHEAAYLKDGLPNSGFPECERMATQFRDAYGHKPLGAGVIPREQYSSVFKDPALPFVERYLDTAPKDEQAQMGDMVRNLNFLRTAHARRTSSLQKQEMDLAENSRLWKPPLQEPTARPEQRNFSKVPLGGLTAHVGRKKKAAPPPEPYDDGFPPSPSVSGLGSLPLTPRSLPTPLVGGTDFPMLTAPMLATIDEGSR